MQGHPARGCAAGPCSSPGPRALLWGRGAQQQPPTPCPPHRCGTDPSRPPALSENVVNKSPKNLSQKGCVALQLNFGIIGIHPGGVLSDFR